MYAGHLHGIDMSWLQTPVFAARVLFLSGWADGCWRGLFLRLWCLVHVWEVLTWDFILYSLMTLPCVSDWFSVIDCVCVREKDSECVRVSYWSRCCHTSRCKSSPDIQPATAHVAACWWSMAGSKSANQAHLSGRVEVRARVHLHVFRPVFPQVKSARWEWSVTLHVLFFCALLNTVFRPFGKHMVPASCVTALHPPSSPPFPPPPLPPSLGPSNSCWHTLSNKTDLKKQPKQPTVGRPQHPSDGNASVLAAGRSPLPFFPLHHVSIRRFKARDKLECHQWNVTAYNLELTKRCRFNRVWRWRWRCYFSWILSRTKGWRDEIRAQISNPGVSFNVSLISFSLWSWSFIMLMIKSEVMKNHITFRTR